MCNARKLALLAAMALTAMALSAPAAFGQLQENHETLELTNTQTGQHCPAVNMAAKTGGCVIHANSEADVEFRKHVFGIESHITSCRIEFTGRINEDAEGYLGHQELTTPIGGPNCIRQPCTESVPPFSANLEWPIHGDETHKSGVAGETGVPLASNGMREILTMVLCIEPVGGGSDESCEISVPLDGHLLSIELGAFTEIPGHGFSGFRCELDGHWNSETFSSDEGIPNQVTIAHIPQENKVESP